jgi:hypothetical protein
MSEHVTLAAVGANVGLVGVQAAIERVSPLLSFALLLLQVSVAALTAWFLYKKVREVDRKQEYYEAKKKEVPKKKARRRKAVLGMLLVAAVIFGFGCATHVKPGSVTTDLATQTQPYNPKDSTSLATESEKVVEYVLPAGSVVTQFDPVTRSNVTFHLSSPMPVRSSSTAKVNSKLGAADMSVSKMLAKLKSVRWIQGVGIVVFLFGVASFAYPPLRLIIGSVTTSVIIAVAGLGLVVIPVMIVGNEVLILLGCVGAALAYLFIHRYGRKSGEVETLRKWVDLNKNGKVDPGEMIEGDK